MQSSRVRDLVGLFAGWDWRSEQEVGGVESEAAKATEEGGRRKAVVVVSFLSLVNLLACLLA